MTQPPRSVPSKVTVTYPTQYWSFSSALSLLHGGNDHYMSEALDEFLLLHRKLLADPSPFAVKDDQPVSQMKELSLHGILYTSITPTNVADANKLGKLLNLDRKETLRVICQVCKRVPERRAGDENLKTKLPDDREKTLEEERLLLYANRILRERREILQCNLSLLANKTNANMSSTLQNIGRDQFLAKDYSEGLIKSLQKTTKVLTSQTFKTGFSDSLDDLYYKETVLFMICCLKLLVELNVQKPEIPVDTITLWFQYMQQTNFCLTLGPFIVERESFSLLHSLCTAVSVCFLDLDSNYGAEDAVSFMNDAVSFGLLNEVICDENNINSIVMYSWSILLLRKSCILAELGDEPANQRFAKVIPSQVIDSDINSLNRRCLELNVFDELLVVNEVLSFEDLYAAVLSTVIQAAMPLITMTPSIASAVNRVLKNCSVEVAERFFDNPSTENAIIITRAKFPLQISPFLKLVSINGVLALSELKEMKSYMTQLPKEQFNRVAVVDDEDTELIKLTEPLEVFIAYEHRNLSLLLSTGTKGKVLPSNSETDVVVTFLYKFNGLALLGRILANLSHVFDPSDTSKVELICDILDALNTVFKSLDRNSGEDIIQYLSAYTDDSDIVELVLRLLEQGLHSRVIEVSQAVVELLCNLVPFASQRIWAYLSKSALLSNGGKEGFVSTIFSAIEMINGEYGFTIAFIKLTEALAHDSLSSNVTKSNTHERVFAQCIQHLLKVFETFVHCWFNQSHHKMELGICILDTFSKVLAIVYGFQRQNAIKAFDSAAKIISDAFLVSDSDSCRSGYPIIAMIDSLENDIDSYEIKDKTGFVTQSWIKCALSFAELVVSIRTFLDYKPSVFETSLFNKLPILVKTYANYPSLRREVLDLMSALTNGKWSHEARPSLLSHLGSDNTQILLNSMVSDLESDFDDYAVKVSVYDFICAVMGGDQEGLTVMLLGVRDIVDNITNEKKQESEQTLIRVLKKNIRDIDNLPDPVALHLVDSMSLVINSWSLTRVSTKDLEFLEQLIKKIGVPVLATQGSSKTMTCYKLKLVSKIAEVLALCLFSAVSEQFITKICDMLTSTRFVDLMKTYFASLSYNKTLHQELADSFSRTFSPFQVSDFRCSLIKRNRYGVNTIYNLGVMETMFGTHDEWPTLRNLVVESAANLQLVGAQIDVALSLGALLTAFGRKYPDKYDEKYMDLCIHLIRTNTAEGIQAEFLSDIYNARIELAFFINYTVFNQKRKPPSSKAFELLKASSELLAAESMDFLHSITEGAGFYRPLLKIIHCSLAQVKDDTEILVEHFGIFGDIFDLVINKATRVVLVEIQNDVYLSRTKKHHSPTKINERTEDLLLILSIVKIFCSIKATSNIEYEISQIVEDNQTVRNLMNLYSFSHLIEVNGDFIFAQFSLMFIQELMRFDTVAKMFVNNGLFTVIQGSSISNTIRNGHVNIISSPQFHRIWTNGLLPIFISTLSKFGSSIMPELSRCLSSFGKQVEYCIESWSRDSSSIRVTSATINETGALLFLYQMFRAYDFQSHIHPEVREDGSVVDMPILPGLDSESKREDFTDYISNLLKHPKFLTSRIVASSMEEQRLIDNGGVGFENFVTGIIEDIASLKDFLV